MMSFVKIFKNQFLTPYCGVTNDICFNYSIAQKMVYL